jgi:hypothetical protein
MKDALCGHSGEYPCRAGRRRADSEPAVNDDQKQANVSSGSDPHLDGSDVDDNPWDDDADGGRTLATDGPSFELPSNIPSPISVPPSGMPTATPAPPPAPARPASPAMPNPPPKRKPQPTMIGFGPPGPALPNEPPPAVAPRPVLDTFPTAPAFAPMPVAVAVAVAASASAPAPLARPVVPLPPRPAAAGPSPPSRPSARGPLPSSPAAPAPDAEDDSWPSSHDQDDAPTMSVASPVASSPLSDRPLRDDLVDPRPAPAAHAGEPFRDSPLPVLHDDSEMELDDPTRAVAREDLMRSQDAHIVVGEDAIGEDATMAAVPGYIDALDPALTAALVQQLKESSQPRLPSAPAFPEPPPHFPQPMTSEYVPDEQAYPTTPQPLGMGMAPVVPSWGEAAPAPSYRSSPQQGMAPAHESMPSSYDGRYESQGHLQAQHGPQSGQPPFQAMPMGMQGAMSYPQHPGAPSAMGQGPQGGYPMHGQPPPGWGAPPAAAQGAPLKLTPQVILLMAVGAVCLAIFVTGIVLFVTTKF